MQIRVPAWLDSGEGLFPGYRLPSMTPDLERIIDLEPDVVLLSPFENSGGYGRVEELGGLRSGQRHNKTLGCVFSRTWKLGRLGSTWRACGQNGWGEK